MAGQKPFEIKMLPRETFGHYLIRVTMAITHHVNDPEFPFCDPTTQARCLLSGLSQEEPWARFRANYQNFIDTRKVENHANRFSKKGGPWKCVFVTPPNS